MSARTALCINCHKDCAAHFWMCDRSESDWCPECWIGTPCADGEHGEECPTQVFDSQSDEDRRNA